MIDATSAARDAILERANQWLASRRGHPQGVVTKIEPYGDDWAGSTEDGFRSIFNVELLIKTPGSEYETRELIEGEELLSLWHAVVRDDEPHERDAGQ